MEQEKHSPASKQGWRHGWSLRRKITIIGILIGLIIALAVGLGVGLTRNKSSGGAQPSSSSSPSSTPITGGNTTVPVDIWKPKNGTTWDYELLYALNYTVPNIEVFSIDLFDNNRSLIQSLQNNGSKVICYFSAGSYENWRPDQDKFNKDDLGKTLDGWPGERWLNVSSENVRSIMEARLDLAVQKGCNGVDPDNTDGYDNDNGLDLTQDDGINYVLFLANAAHSRKLSVGLKNSGAIVDSVIGQMEWSINEQCVQYNECDIYAPFIQQGKPVFHVEYPKGDSTNNNMLVAATTKTSICDSSQARGFSTIIKNMLLDNFIETCPDTA